MSATASVSMSRVTWTREMDNVTSRHKTITLVSWTQMMSASVFWSLSWKSSSDLIPLMFQVNILKVELLSSGGTAAGSLGSSDILCVINPSETYLHIVAI